MTPQALVKPSLPWKVSAALSSYWFVRLGVFKKTLKPIQRTLEISTDGFWIGRSLFFQVLGWLVFFLLESGMQVD
jgi:hypothetical protein